ncbi:MAG: hypothetical protein Q8M83_02900 [bacterium]|nr:hypothetical protein [bacterium]
MEQNRGHQLKQCKNFDFCITAQVMLPRQGFGGVFIIPNEEQAKDCFHLGRATEFQALSRSVRTLIFGTGENCFLA